MTVTKAPPRQTVQIILSDGRIYEAPTGTPIEAFIHQAESDADIPKEHRAVAVRIHNRLRELTFPIQNDVHVETVTMLVRDGARIYRRSLSFLLVVAANRCFPEAKVAIDHSLPERGYFCRVENRPNFTVEELASIESQMRELVEKDLPIRRKRLTIDEAKTYFNERQDYEKVQLLEVRGRDYLNIYTLDGFADYFFGYMTPSTGYLESFSLEWAEGGFLLRYPDIEHPIDEPPPVRFNKLNYVFRQTKEWLQLLGVENFAQLNQATRDGRLRELIFVSEALQERRIGEIGMSVAERANTRLVLIAGPSSSGKTTFSKRLAIQLMTHGLKPFTLELDNYFVDREKTPLDEDGEYDFESLHAINLDLFNDHLQRLIAGEKVQLPRFDFLQGKSIPDREVQLSSAHVLIIEGIHGLNPALVPNIAPELYYRVYVSALTQLNIDRYNRISTTDVRLLRRIVRDAVNRGWTATDTLERWGSVTRGERVNIFPFQENADAMFNSALIYELAVLRPIAEPHLLRVKQDHPKRIEAKRLLSFLSWLIPVTDDHVPDNSILREFIGGSNLRDYHPS